MISQIYPNSRRGLVLSAKLGIVNENAVSKNALSADRLFAAARRDPPRLNRGSVEEKKFAVTVHGAHFPAGRNWPVRSGVPIPPGELASASNVEVLDGAGNAVPTQSQLSSALPQLGSGFHPFEREVSAEFSVQQLNSGATK